MPYSPQHKQNSRRRILESAYRLFVTRGYALTSIDEVMQAAQLTRGAFYAHFDSKQALYRDAIRHAAENSYLASDKPGGVDDAQWLLGLLDLYLSEAHVRLEGRPCPLASLISDMSVREPGIRDVYTDTFKGFNRYLNRYLGQEEALNRTSLAVSAMMIGGVAIARAIRDEALSRELLTSCRQMAGELLEASQAEDIPGA